MVGQNLKSSHMAFPYYHRNSRVRDLGNGFVNNAVATKLCIFCRFASVCMCSRVVCGYTYKRISPQKPFSYILILDGRRHVCVSTPTSAHQLGIYNTQGRGLCAPTARSNLSLCF